MRAAVCPSTGRRRWSQVEERPTPDRRSHGQVRVRVEAAAVNFPDVLLVAERLPGQACRRRSCPGSEFAGVVDESRVETDGFRGR